MSRHEMAKSVLKCR